jgi:hypothetical protein
MNNSSDVSMNIIVKKEKKKNKVTFWRRKKTTLTSGKTQDTRLKVEKNKMATIHYKYKESKKEKRVKTISCYTADRFYRCIFWAGIKRERESASVRDSHAIIYVVLPR